MPENDLISRSDVLEMINRTKTAAQSDEAGFTKSQKNAIKSISDLFSSVVKDIPRRDAAPVVHARWIYSGDMDSDGNSQGYCSRCGAGDKHRADLKNLVPYCWKCGAKMDAEEDNDGYQTD